MDNVSPKIMCLDILNRLFKKRELYFEKLCFDKNIIKWFLRALGILYEKLI